MYIYNYNKGLYFTQLKKAFFIEFAKLLTTRVNNQKHYLINLNNLT